MARQLIDYLPPVIAINRESIGITEGQQPKVDWLWAELERLLNEQFLDTMTIYGVKWWEKILGLIPEAGATLDERKLAIYVRLNENLPYTIRTFQALLDNMFGEGVAMAEVFHNEYRLQITVNVDESANVEKLMSQLRAMRLRVVPANLIAEYATDNKLMESGVYISAAMGRGMMESTLPELVPEYDLNARLRSGAAMIGSIMSTRLPALI